MICPRPPCHQVPGETRDMQMAVADILHHEKQHGLIQPDSVVMIRSDYYKQWGQPDFASRKRFPGVQAGCIEGFAPEAKGIFFHGHEVCDQLQWCIIQDRFYIVIVGAQIRGT